MKRFLALVLALGFCTAFGLGCTKQAPKEEATTETPAVTEEAKPAVEAAPAVEEAKPAAEAAPAAE